MAIQVADRDELDFGPTLARYVKSGVPTEAVVALYNGLNSDNAATRAKADAFLRENTVGLGDPTNREDVAARQRVVSAAQRLATSLHVAPPSASLRRLYLPSDGAINDKLDREHPHAGPRSGSPNGGKGGPHSPGSPLGVRDTSPRRTDLANAGDDIDLSNTYERPIADDTPAHLKPRFGKTYVVDGHEDFTAGW